MFKVPEGPVESPFVKIEPTTVNWDWKVGNKTKQVHPLKLVRNSYEFCLLP